MFTLEARPTAFCATAQSVALLLCMGEAVALDARGEQPPDGAWLDMAAVHNQLPTPVTPPPSWDGRSPAELAGVTARLWMSSGRADIGIGLGSVGYVTRPPDAYAAGSGALVGATPIMTIGLRYRMSEQHTLLADGSTMRGFGADPGAPYFTKSVSLEWKSATPKFGFERGALSLQMDSGYRLSLRARQGKLTLNIFKRF